MADELVAISMPEKVIAEWLGHTQVAGASCGLFVKSQYVANHAVERWPEQVTALCKKRIDRRATVLEMTAFRPHAETHFAGLGILANVVEQFNEIRVGPIVENDEPRIDRNSPSIFEHIDRIRVPANSTITFENGDVMILAQQIGCYIAGDSGANNCDLHRITTSAERVAVS